MLRGRLLDETLLVYLETDCNADAAADLLARKARQYHWPARSSAEIATLVSDAFLSTDLDYLAALCDLEAPSNEPALRFAVDYAQQYSLAEWAKVQNLKGVAPPTQAVVTEWEKRRMAVPESARPPTWGACGSAATRKKASRWRERFGGRFGKLPVREDVPQESMIAKAPIL